MSCLYFKVSFKLCETNNSHSDSKCSKRRLVLSCSKETLCITKKITSNYGGDFYYLNCLHSFRTENKLSLMKEYVKVKIFVEM